MIWSLKAKNKTTLDTTKFRNEVNNIPFKDFRKHSLWTYPTHSVHIEDPRLDISIQNSSHFNSLKRMLFLINISNSFPILHILPPPHFNPQLRIKKISMNRIQPRWSLRSKNRNKMFPQLLKWNEICFYYYFFFRNRKTSYKH